jgi:hypothetical protein
MKRRSGFDWVRFSVYLVLGLGIFLFLIASQFGVDDFFFIRTEWIAFKKPLIGEPDPVQVQSPEPASNVSMFGSSIGLMYRSRRILPMCERLGRVEENRELMDRDLGPKNRSA